MKLLDRYSYDSRILVLGIAYKPNVDDMRESPSAEIIASCDCVIIATDHAQFDYELIQRHAKVIVDTRGRYRQQADNVRRA